MCGAAGEPGPGSGGGARVSLSVSGPGPGVAEIYFGRESRRSVVSVRDEVEETHIATYLMRG